MLHAGKKLPLKKGWNNNKMVAFMQLGEGVQLQKFKQDIYTGPFNPCYCCTNLCHNNGGLFIEASDPLLLQIHDRELSELVKS